VFEGAIRHRASNIEHQMRTAWRPAHLLLGVHRPSVQEFSSPVGRASCQAKVAGRLSTAWLSVHQRGIAGDR
jgi:hypothetical protein